MRNFLLLVLFAAPTLAEDALVTRLAGVRFRVADIEKARKFYSGTFGFDEAFQLKDAGGKIQSVAFKVNDDQYLEFSPGEVDGFRLEAVSLLASDLSAVAAALRKQGIVPTEAATGPDGMEFLSFRDPDRTEIRFVRYLPDSKQAK